MLLPGDENYPASSEFPSSELMRWSSPSRGFLDVVPKFLNRVYPLLCRDVTRFGLSPFCYERENGFSRGLQF